MKIVLGLVLALLIGVVCRLTGIPSPAPPVIVGALLVLAMTSGYIVADRFVRRPAKHMKYCGGPSGEHLSDREFR
jgi:XapX domain-containing protein